MASPLASPSPVVQLNTPVDFRRFRKDTLGSLFFGNAIYLATVRASTADIISAPVGNTAGSVREAIRGTLEERIQAQIDLFAQDQKEKGLNSVPTWNLFQPGSPTLVTNLSALPLNEIRLGAEAEAPLCVRYTGAFPGLAVVLPDIDGKVRIQSFGS